MAILHVECHTCKNATELAGYLEPADLVGTSLEGLSIEDAIVKDTDHYESTGKTLVLDAWAKFENTYDSATNTYICPICHQRSTMTTL